MLFVAKANSIKSSISKIEKQLDDIEKNVDAEDGFEKVDENGIEEDALRSCDFKWRISILLTEISFANNIFACIEHYSLTEFGQLTAPILGVFAPPPNSK